MLVDDEPITLKITRKFLNDHGLNTDVASNATSALEMLAKQSYKLVIIDISMPTLSGFDLLQLMQSFGYSMPVIFLSNNDNEWTIKEAMNMGAAKFLSKEKDFNILPDIVREVLASV